MEVRNLEKACNFLCDTLEKQTGITFLVVPFVEPNRMGIIIACDCAVIFQAEVTYRNGLMETMDYIIEKITKVAFTISLSAKAA